jgi:hypothetical protein
MASIVLASATILPIATADNSDDIVENISSAKVGESITADCKTTSTNLEKRGKLVYEKDTGSLTTGKGD